MGREGRLWPFLIAMIGSGEGHHLGFRYILAPAAAGAQILLTVALPINNVARSRRYPEIWL